MGKRNQDENPPVGSKSPGWNPDLKPIAVAIDSKRGKWIWGHPKTGRPIRD